MIVDVVDTETTGLCGCRYGDRIVDIGIVEVDTDALTVTPVYSEIVGYDVSVWEPEQRNAWIFSHSDLTLGKVAAGKPFGEVVGDVHRILDGRKVTSYNLSFDFHKFLIPRPWSVDCLLCPDIMTSAHRVVGGDLLLPYGGTSWPKLSKAYEVLCPGDPAEIGGSQAHRALSDAVVAGYVMVELIRRGVYPTNPGWFARSSFIAALED